MPEPPKTRTAVIGAGAFGRNHLRVWRELEAAGHPIELCAVVDPAPDIAASVARELGRPVYSSIDELLAAQPLPHAASVAVPTSRHFDIALQLLSAGVDVLLEKPMTTTLAQADQLIELAKRGGRILQVGHLERFNPAVRAVRPIVNRPL
ncbi:MAG: Gfo/Idh/MocA family oxidoreductase, partial [Acidobacteriaceae bacterium]